MVKQNDAITAGLDLCRDRLGVDGSAVIPSVVGLIYSSIGTCGNCKYWVQHPTNENLKRCAGDNGCEVTGEDFFCASYEKKKGK